MRSSLVGLLARPLQKLVHPAFEEDLFDTLSERMIEYTSDDSIASGLDMIVDICFVAPASSSNPDRGDVGNASTGSLHRRAAGHATGVDGTVASDDKIKRRDSCENEDDVGNADSHRRMNKNNEKMMTTRGNISSVSNKKNTATSNEHCNDDSKRVDEEGMPRPLGRNNSNSKPSKEHPSNESEKGKEERTREDFAELACYLLQHELVPTQVSSILGIVMHDMML